uniref:Uncharacterized protein n=1 Tax=Zea mays TaxID=4577 RepID=C4J1R1_MAIZE|nr:unknown [Zea mays]
MVRPSAGTLAIVAGSFTSTSSPRWWSPCRALMAARSAAGSASHSGRHVHTVAGPYVSVSPYEWITRNPSSSIRNSTCGAGGAPPVITVTGLFLPAPSGALSSAVAFTTMLSTVGAPPMCVTPCAATAAKMAPEFTLRRHTLVPPCAATPHTRHHPLQWNMGTVHRYTGSAVMSLRSTDDSEFRYAPRWVYTTPLGRDVVPDV